LHITFHKRMFVYMSGTRRGPRPHLAATHAPRWSGSWNGKLHGTITRDGDGWVAYMRLEDPPGLSPITTVGRSGTVEAAQVATDEVWAARSHAAARQSTATCP
jgi:hypothetical protein